MRTPSRPRFLLPFALLLLPGLAWPATTAPSTQSYDAALVVVLDVSGSMKESVAGGVKRDLAPRGLLQTLEALPAGTATALRLLGQAPGSDECTASTLAVPFAAFDRTRWSEAMGKITWDGATPLVFTMRQALADLHKVDARRKEMLIVGDGEETCGEDPVGVARAEADGVRIHTISLGERTSHQLAGIALVTGGTYTRAFDETSFETAATDALPGAGDMPATAPNTAGGAAPIEVILDVSNSMWGQVDGRVKMDLAREALRGALVDLPATVPVGLRAYGHRVPYQDKEAGCTDTELLLTPRPGGAQAVLASAENLTPTGQTPIARSLEAAAGDLEARGGGVLLLLSDGIESCGGDPVAVAEAIRARGIEVVIHAVGLGVDADAAAALGALAGAGGGQYFDAPTADQLMSSMQTAVRSSTDFILATDPTSHFPSPVQRVQGGDSIADAQLIEPGDYSFEKHLFREQRYFAVAGDPGEELVLSGLVCALEIGRLHDGTVTYMGNPGMFTIERLDAEGNKLRGRSLVVRGDMGEWSELPISVGSDGYARFRVGRPLGNVHRDMIFRVARH